MADHAVTVHDLSKEVAGKPILSQVSFEVATNAFVVITGRSGAGKSTLLSILGALDEDYAGRIEYAGRVLHGERERAGFRQRQVGFVFQIPRLFSGLSLWQNLTAASWIGGQPLDVARARFLLGRVGLDRQPERGVQSLSGGERQRLTLARALLPRPRLLLCDEPTGNLDRNTGDEILDLVTELRREEALTVIMVSHDGHVAARATKVLDLADGKLTGNVPSPVSGEG
jgi:ABC-type lipoprotein export system ATPase subunit